MYFIFIFILFVLQGCVAQNQDMYAEQSFQDRQQRSEDKAYIFKEYVGPVIAIPGAMVVGTIQGVGEVATYAAENPELMQQGIKTYQQLEHDQRVERERADRDYAKMQRELQRSEERTRRASAQVQQRIQAKQNGSLGYSSSQPQTSTSKQNGYSTTGSSKTAAQQNRANTYGQQNSTNNSYNYSNNTKSLPIKKVEEKPYQYEFIEGMAFIIRHEKTKLSKVKYSGKGPAGSISSYETEEKALATAGCKSYQGVGHFHTYGKYSGKVYYCNKPLRPGFFSTDIEGDYGVGPGLTSGRKRWLCKDKALNDNWQERCKEI